MKTFFLAMVGAVVGSIVALLLAIFIGAQIIGGLSQPPEMPKNMVLSLDLRNTWEDQAPRSGFDALFGQEGFIDVISKLDAAIDDERVKGVYIRAAEFGIGSSRAEELRDVLKDFQASGKFVIAHSQGTYGGGPSAYRAIATADEIWVQPGSDLIAGGISFETLFLKGLFDKLSISPQIEAFYEYKNSPNGYQETDYTDPHREAMTRLAESVWTISLADIAADRDITIDAARAALESSPVSAEEMIRLHLADKSGWPLSAEDAVRSRAGENVEFIGVSAYRPDPVKFSAPTIAVVGGEGPIVTGWSEEGLFAGGKPSLSSDTISNAILEAAANDRVEAIVFRVDSPGGSPVASDQIWNAVNVAQTKYGKPVVISMGSVAASGGYYISTGADWIVANRTTITGSIGIFGGKIAIAEGLAKIGVNVRSIDVGGPFTGAFTSADVFTEEQRTLLRAWLKRGYDRFLTLVAEGRNKSFEDVHEVARGRVWSGEDALEKGLVDELGGIRAAMVKAAALAEIDPDADVRVLYYPTMSTDFPFSGAMGASATADLETLSQISDVLSDPRLQAILQEYEATRAGTIQARIPALTER
ncbi:MAG: signal peptide peptidase SppA [Alphaproteobacteria bacterium]|nr:signal peptide peptidase SppA [Alphaproteobacteria bacterium]